MAELIARASVAKSRLVVFLMLVLAAFAGAASAVDVVKPLKAGRLAVSFAYQFELLDEALKRSVAKYGPYLEQAYTEPMAPARDQREIGSGRLINILIAEPGIKALDDGAIAVPIALDKGMHGTRVVLIRRGDQEKVKGITNIEDLRRFRIGQGAAWGDVKIYEHNGIALETASSFESLLAMLDRGRIDLFPRGAIEIGGELAAFRDRYPNLAIERHLVIRYSFPQYFFVSRSAPRLAERIAFGLREMIRDGSFDAIFDKHFAKDLAELKLGQRKVIELDNPFLPPWASPP